MSARRSGDRDPAARRSGELAGLYQAAGRRRGEQRTMIVLGVVGLALALTLAAFFIGPGFFERIEAAEERPAPPSSGGASSLAEAALGGPVS